MGRLRFGGLKNRRPRAEHPEQILLTLMYYPLLPFEQKQLPIFRVPFSLFDVVRAWPAWEGALCIAWRT